MKTRHMVRVVERVPQSRYKRSPEVEERFIGWATRRGIDPLLVEMDGIVVIERDGKRRLSVREYIREDGFFKVDEARMRIIYRRRSIPIDALPDWL